MIVPALTRSGRVIEDKWMVPGCEHPLTTQEIRDRATETGQFLTIIRR